MCDFCKQSERLTRRRFLKLGVGASIGALLAACAAEQTPPAGPAIPTMAPTSSLLTIPADYADLAGRVSEAGETHFVLAAPVGSQALSLATGFQLLDTRGNPAGDQSPPVGSSVLVWLQGEAASSVQFLPPIAATNDIPAGLAQPRPTGETVARRSLVMISRAGWGAAEKQFSPGGESGLFDERSNPGGWLEYPEPLADQLHSVVIHHAALEFYDGPQEIQRLHMLHRGFADVGYHYLIDGLGQIYEGRPIGVRGAHVGGRNTGAVGICLLGNFEEVGPLTAQLNTARLLAGYLQDAYQLTYLAGHRDFQPGQTVCPGANLWPLLPELAADLNLTFGAPAG